MWTGWKFRMTTGNAICPVTRSRVSNWVCSPDSERSVPHRTSNVKWAQPSKSTIRHACVLGAPRLQPFQVFSVNPVSRSTVARHCPVQTSARGLENCTVYSIPTVPARCNHEHVGTNKYRITCRPELRWNRLEYRYFPIGLTATEIYRINDRKGTFVRNLL